MSPSQLSYCGEQVRRHDHDRYLTCLFAPADRRDSLFALYAFNHEIARTSEVVSEAMLGQIRLQWWRESLAGIYGGRPREHAVVQALAVAIGRHDLSRPRFEALIDARAFDLTDQVPGTLAQLVEYAEGTSGLLVQLALEVLGDRGRAALDCGREIGIAWALCGLLRATRFHAARKRIFLPLDLQAQFGLDLRDFFELRPSEATSSAVRQVAEEARRHLEKARARKPEVSAAARPALMLGVLADRYLAQLDRIGFDPFNARLADQPRGNAWRLGTAALLRKY